MILFIFLVYSFIYLFVSTFISLIFDFIEKAFPLLNFYFFLWRYNYTKLNLIKWIK